MKWNKFLISVFLLALISGCATPKKEVVIEYKEVNKIIIKAEKKKMEKLYVIDFGVNENKEITLTEEEFKKLMYNMIMLQKHIYHLDGIIKYYEKSIE